MNRVTAASLPPSTGNLPVTVPPYRSLVLQVSLLSLLRLVIEVEHLTPQPINTVVVISKSEGESKTPEAQQPAEEEEGVVNSPLFLQTVVMGLLQSHSAFHVRIYWLDFITQILPHLSADLAAIVVPVASCLADLLNEHSHLPKNSFNAQAQARY